MPIEKLGSSSLVSSVFLREGNCTEILNPSKKNKKLTSSYLRTGVRKKKDFVHSGSIGLV